MLYVSDVYSRVRQTVYATARSYGSELYIFIAYIYGTCIAWTYSQHFKRCRW